MDIVLPTVQSGLVIGILDVDDGGIEVVTNIKYNCKVSGDCCNNLIVPVSDFDIQRIEENGFEYDQIVSDDPPAITKPKNKFGTLEKSYLIKRKPFTGECTFMEEEKCTIHEFKPFSCRIFPFQLRHISSSKVEVLIHDSNYCPSVLSCSAEESETEELLKDLLKDMNSELDRREEYLAKYGKSI
jgi:Fe-S-cluster containining protein